MSRQATFGLRVRPELATQPSGTFDADRYSAVIASAEQAGYDHFFVADHAFVPSYWANLIGDLYLDPFTLLAYLAAKTSRIELVFSCLVVPYRQPFTTAKAIATLDQLSRGRVALGVVPGYLKEEFRAFGLNRQERNEMTTEFVEIMLELWTNDRAEYQGRYYQFSGISMKPKCQRTPHVPIWVGGSSHNAMRRVAQFGDVWHPLGFQPVEESYFSAHREEFTDSMQTGDTTPERLRDGLDYIRRLADEESRDISELQVVVLPGSPVDKEESADAPVDSSARGLRVGSGGDQVVDLLGRYLEAGATGFSINPPGDSLEECLDNLTRFAEEVIPRLR